MPVHIVIAHDDIAFRTFAVRALEAEGYSVASYEAALAAMVALEAPLLDVLITRLWFMPGRSNGIALALMAKVRRPSAKVIFTSPPGWKSLRRISARLWRCQSRTPI
jgi:DNA-binding NtrC family response regulator